MSYRVIIPKSLLKELDRLPARDLTRTLSQLTELENNPRYPGTKKLSGRDAWQIRVGDYRVIYEINDTEKTVVLIRIRHRRDVYR